MNHANHLSLISPLHEKLYNFSVQCAKPLKTEDSPRQAVEQEVSALQLVQPLELAQEIRNGSNPADEVRAVAEEPARQNGSTVIIVTTKAHTRRVRTVWKKLLRRRPRDCSRGER